MGYGNRIFLGFIGEAAIREAASGLGLDVPDDITKWANCDLGDADDGDDEDGGNDALRARLKEIAAALRDAHLALIAAVGWTCVAVQEDRFQTTLVTDTPFGRRNIRAFELDFSLDTSECNEEPEHAVLGVILSGRYGPFFLDCRDVDGDLYMVGLDAELFSQIELAKETIVARLPEFATATAVLKPIWY